MTQPLKQHFELAPNQRPLAQSKNLADQLLCHPSWFETFVRKRFNGIGLSAVEHLDAVREHVRPRIVKVLVQYVGTNYENYLGQIRARAITEYLQKFSEDVRPRKPPIRE